MNPVVHFEMPAEDKNRMADFYTKAFDWKTQMLGPDMNDYVLVEPRQTRLDCGRFKLRRYYARRHSGVVNVDDDREICFERVTDNHICCSRFAVQSAASPGRRRLQAEVWKNPFSNVG